MRPTASEVSDRFAPRLLFGDDYVGKANAGVLALAMIETAKGLDMVDQIVTVPGLDGVFAGPADLALSLGCPPRLDPDDTRVVAALERIAAAAIGAGIKAGTACDSGAYVKKMHDAGYRLFVVGTDLKVMMTGSMRLLSELA